MFVKFDITGTKFLKVTVTQDNQFRFKVPESEQEFYDIIKLSELADEMMNYPVLTESLLTLRGKLTEDNRLPLYNETGSKKNRKRNHIYTVIFEDI